MLSWGLPLIYKSITSWKESQLPSSFNMHPFSEGSQGYKALSLLLQGSVSFTMLGYTSGVFKDKCLCNLKIRIESI